MPGRYSTDFGGIAYGDDVGDFTYIVTAKNVFYAQALRYKFPLLSGSGSLDSSTNPEDFYGIYSSQYQNDQSETSLLVTGSASANVTLEIMDWNNFERWYNGMSYQSLHTTTNLKGGDSVSAFNISSTDAMDAMWWKVSITGPNTASYSLTADRYRTVSSGMTHTALHEASHALGMSHPHDGFSWKFYQNNQYYCNNANDTDGFYDVCNGEYVHWLWDESATYMSYATQPHTMGTLDRMAIQRATGYRYLRQLQMDIQDYLDGVFSRHQYLPEPLVTDVEQSISLHEAALAAFTSHNYNATINNVFAAQESLQAAMSIDDTAAIEFTLELTGLGNIALGEYVDVMVITKTTNTSLQIGMDVVLALQFTSWQDLNITVLYQGVVRHLEETMTWSGVTIAVDTTGIPTLSLPTTTVTETTTVTTPVTTTIPVTVTNPVTTTVPVTVTSPVTVTNPITVTVPETVTVPVTLTKNLTIQDVQTTVVTKYEGTTTVLDTTTTTSVKTEETPFPAVSLLLMLPIVSKLVSKKATKRKE
jgi:hypothetical protein